MMLLVITNTVYSTLFMFVFAVQLLNVFYRHQYNFTFLEIIGFVHFSLHEESFNTILPMLVSNQFNDLKGGHCLTLHLLVGCYWPAETEQMRSQQNR